MRIALFGGTFDPPHLGHLRIAATAADRFALDQIHFTPTGRQPLKPTSPIASFADRLAMTTLACAASPDASRLTASTFDAPHPDGTPNYTIEALSTLGRQNPAAELFHITGADAFTTLRSWREPDRLLDLAEWIVISRPGAALDLAPLALTPGQLARVHLLTGIHEEISATEIRRRLHSGQDCSHLLPPSVADYIVARHLYR
jgi:nicotinate-nucleotide adenylyltransferase